MTEMHEALPDALQPFARNRVWRRITIGESSADTFCLDCDGESALYLKICPSLPRRELLREKERLDWLQGRLPVPEVVHYEVAGGREYLLLTSIPGAGRCQPERLYPSRAHRPAAGDRAEADPRHPRRGLSLRRDP